MPRLPSSLKWLIDRRGRVDGEIKKIEVSLAKCQRLANDLEKLKETLASIDQTLTLHDVKVNPEYIPTIRSHEVRTTLPHGELTRGILMCLRLNKAKNIGTNEITAFMAARYADLEAKPTDFSTLKRSVRYRLKNLCRQQIVQRHHSLRGNGNGFWSLASEARDLTLPDILES